MKIEYTWSEVSLIVAQHACNKVGKPGKNYNPMVSLQIDVEKETGKVDPEKGIKITVTLGNPEGETP